MSQDKKETLDDAIKRAKEGSAPKFGDVPPSDPERNLDDELIVAWFYEQFMNNLLQGNFNLVKSIYPIGIEMPMRFYGEERPLGNFVCFFSDFDNVIHKKYILETLASTYVRYDENLDQWIESIYGPATHVMKDYIGKYGQDYLFALADYMRKEINDSYNFYAVMAAMQTVADDFERGSQGDGFGDSLGDDIGDR